MIKKALWIGIALTVVGLVAAPGARADDWNKETKITFSQPVDVAGHLLPAGTYVFKMADASDRHIVQIFSADGQTIIATVMTIPDYRLTATDETVIRFSEVPAGSPEAVRAWFYPGRYDGVAEGLRQLRSGHGERRALVVISDGGDNASVRRYSDVLALVRQSDAVIYAIGLMGASPEDEDNDAGLLRRLCRDSGGVAYFPRTMEEIAAVSAHIAADLGAQYTLGFVPEERPAASAFRKIEVKVTAPGHGRLHVRTRSGYVAAGAGATP
jgi:VWFA-related protein